MQNNKLRKFSLCYLFLLFIETMAHKKLDQESLALRIVASTFRAATRKSSAMRYHPDEYNFWELVRYCKSQRKVH